MALRYNYSIKHFRTLYGAFTCVKRQYKHLSIVLADNRHFIHVGHIADGHKDTTKRGHDTLYYKSVYQCPLVAYTKHYMTKPSTISHSSLQV